MQMHGFERKMPDTTDYLNYINKNLSSIFDSIVINDSVCFRLNNGSIARIDVFERKKAFCVEYAYDIDMARRNIFPEDGDWYYIEDYSKEQMLKEIIEELML